jgi:hypothetical protein
MELIGGAEKRKEIPRCVWWLANQSLRICLNYAAQMQVLVDQNEFSLKDPCFASDTVSTHAQ